MSSVVLVDRMFHAVVERLLPALTDDLHLSRAAAGTLLGSVPGGILDVRWGPRQTVFVGLLLMAVSTLGRAASHRAAPSRSSTPRGRPARSRAPASVG